RPPCLARARRRRRHRPISGPHTNRRWKQRPSERHAWVHVNAGGVIIYSRTTQRSGGVVRNNSANLSSSSAEASETVQYVNSSSVQRTMLYPSPALSEGAESAWPAAGTAVRLIRCLPRP